MSFGILKQFKDLKGDNTQKVSDKYYQHVIIGHDLGAVMKLLDIKKQFPEESVRLISTRPINRQALVENYEYGVSHLRSEVAVQNIYRKFHDSKILPQAQEAQFYKDGKFHDFGGRAKSMEIKSGEDFFAQKGYRFELNSFFSRDDWDNLDKILLENSEIRIFESIEKTTPEDLVEKKEWTLTFKDYGIVSCQNLYMSMSPKKFLGHLTNKEQLTPDLIEVCSSVNTQSAISVTWKLNKEIFTEDRTLFIPQSMTHEWGHFIVEFETYNHQKKEQLCHVLFLIHEEEPQSEDLAAKIKLMKRVLDRVFNDIEKHIKQEFIRFDDEMFVSDIKDNLLEQVGFDYPTLKFLGQASAMSPDLSQEKFLSRVFLN